MTQNQNVPRPTRDMFPDGTQGDRLYRYMLELVAQLGTDRDDVRDIVARESIKPVQATDTGTDTYESDQDVELPSDTRLILRDFQSANTTTSPTLDGISVVSKDSSAVAAGDILGVHWLQYDGTNFLLLNKAS